VARVALNRDVICDSARLREGGQGVRFTVELAGSTVPAFAIRYGGRVYAFVNRCAHRGVELDWKEGYFFDRDGDFLICATHGARYVPGSGSCAGGPCAGGRLTALAVAEEGEVVRLVAENARLVEALKQSLTWESRI
jgi:nitrite reductase/ring-hydroxylating ferredoxin subunit